MSVEYEKKNIRDNKKVLKNTFMLYIRTLLILLITLYSSRVLLRTLGAEDYGIYNVVAGFVAMFSFLSSSIAAGTSRFFAFEIGAGDKTRLKQFFSLSILSFWFFAIIIVLLSETFGLWFVKTQLVIPVERQHAAIIAYHFAILSFVVNLLSTSYKSMIIAHEKMNVYAYIGILEVALNLLLLLFLTTISYDKLELYAFLMLGVSIVVTTSYYLYCKIKYSETNYSFFWNKNMFKEFFGYSVWVTVGSFTGLCRSQGINMLLNVFFNPIVNAARGIAYQVLSAINQFVSNFYTASRPQITKLYAAGQYKDMLDLVFSSSRVCFLLTLLFSLPIYIEAPAILTMWLGEFPEYTVSFTRLVLIIVLLDTFGYPFQAAVSATGNIKWFQLVVGGTNFLVLPITYIFLKLGHAPESAFYVTIAMSCVAQVARMIFMKRLLNMSMIAFTKEVIFRALVVTALSPLVAVIIKLVSTQGLVQSLLTIILSALWIIFLSLYLGVSTSEREKVLAKAAQIKTKLFARKACN